jgi:hypothetical protein
MRKQIARNDYYKLIRETGRIPKDDEYEILPLDLSAYSLNIITQRIADRNFMEETKDRNGNYMLQGHWLSDLCYKFALQCGFQLHQVNGYSAYAFSDEQMAVFTYTEGDIYLTPFTDRDKYEKEKTDTIKFYKEVY